MNKYRDDFLSIASKFDAIVNFNGKITDNAVKIVENDDNKAALYLLKNITEALEISKSNEVVKKLAGILKDSLIKYYGYAKLLDICNFQEDKDKDERSLGELLAELDNLVGLNYVKMKVKDLIAYHKVQELRKRYGLSVPKETLHLAFMGNPGTGKTTVARIIGRVYKHLGLLSKGHFIEASRTDLIAGYQGQTAIKVKNLINRARGGVLFIDEAYSITENESSDSYGRECLTELTKALEDYREDLVVIVAGYTAPMKKFFDSNPGLKSRFNTFIFFEDYSVEELEKILINICENNDYCLTDNLKNDINNFINEYILKKDANFSNGRFMRNIYEDLIMNHARRVVNTENPDRYILSTLDSIDFNCNKFIE